MKKLSTRTKVITISSLLIILIANMNMLSDFLAGAEHALIREMRLVGKLNFGLGKYQENLDEVVLKHIPLGISADVALEICHKNGFKTYEIKDVGKQDATYHPGMEKYFICSQEKTRWYLIGTDEYRAIVYLKNNKVGAVAGRFFAQTFGGL